MKERKRGRGRGRENGVVAILPGLECSLKLGMPVIVFNNRDIKKKMREENN